MDPGILLIVSGVLWIIGTIWFFYGRKRKLKPKKVTQNHSIRSDEEVLIFSNNQYTSPIEKSTNEVGGDAKGHQQMKKTNGINTPSEVALHGEQLNADKKVSEPVPNLETMKEKNNQNKGKIITDFTHHNFNI